MDHARAEELFSEYWEGEMSPREALAMEKHFDECADCRRAFEAFQKTVRTVSGLHRVPPPPDLLRRVQGEIRRRSRGRFYSDEPLPLRVPFEWVSFFLIVALWVAYLVIAAEPPKTILPASPFEKAREEAPEKAREEAPLRAPGREPAPALRPQTPEGEP